MNAFDGRPAMVAEVFRWSNEFFRSLRGQIPNLDADHAFTVVMSASLSMLTAVEKLMLSYVPKLVDLIT